MPHRRRSKHYYLRKEYNRGEPPTFAPGLHAVVWVVVKKVTPRGGVLVGLLCNGEEIWLPLKPCEWYCPKVTEGRITKVAIPRWLAITHRGLVDEKTFEREKFRRKWSKPIKVQIDYNKYIPYMNLCHYDHFDPPFQKLLEFIREFEAMGDLWWEEYVDRVTQQKAPPAIID